MTFIWGGVTKMKPQRRYAPLIGESPNKPYRIVAPDPETEARLPVSTTETGEEEPRKPSWFWRRVNAIATYSAVGIFAVMLLFSRFEWVGEALFFPLCGVLALWAVSSVGSGVEGMR